MKYPEILFNVVLIEPEIPQNTGNIGRTCVGSHSILHLVGPYGFELSDRRVKRAGLDYWPHLELREHKNWDSWWSQVRDPSRVFFFSTKSEKPLYRAQLQSGDWLVFGCETKGLDREVIEKFSDQTYRIPMRGQVRSLNLATAAAIALYEGVRQIELTFTHRAWRAMLSVGAVVLLKGRAFVSCQSPCPFTYWPKVGLSYIQENTNDYKGIIQDFRN